MRIRIAAVILLLAAASVAEAQLPQGKWWRRPELVRELQLTEEQQQKLDETFRVASEELIDAKASVEKLQIALRTELDREQLRKQDVVKAADRVSQARGKLFERELVMLVDMRSVLTDTQWNRLRTQLDRQREQRRQGAMQGPPGGRGRMPAPLGPGTRRKGP